jgi:hypothetical protein
MPNGVARSHGRGPARHRHAGRWHSGRADTRRRRPAGGTGPHRPALRGDGPHAGRRVRALAAGRRAHARARLFDVHTYAGRLAELYQRIAPVAGIREFA